MRALDVQPQSKPEKADKRRLTREQRIAMYLDASAPAISGCGGHNQTFKVACALVNGFALGEEEAFAWMLYYNRGCEPSWSEAELRHKIRDALNPKTPPKHPRGYLLRDGEGTTSAAGAGHLLNAGEFVQSPEPKPVYDLAYLQDFTSQLSDEIDTEYFELRGEFSCWNRSPAGFLHKVFRPGESVWVTGKAVSRDGLIWRNDGPVQNLAELNHLQSGLDGVWFLSNPIDGAPHQLERLMSEHNTEGISFRAAECVTDWRHVVLETDDAPGDLWLKALCLLRLPVVAIYHSGSRGAHALVNLGASTVEQWHERLAPHREHVIRLGACPGTLTPVRLSRLPNCSRGQTGQLQQLLYLASNADSTPIARRPFREHPLAVWERYLVAARFGRSDNDDDL
jgi:hypothetical protein